MPPKRILVADDSQVITHMISEYFGDKGYIVNTAASGNEALEIASRQKPSLLICDVMMPGVDGYEVVRQLREKPATAKMPIILLTTRGGVADRISGLQAGADDYVVKPFDLRELELRVQALLERATEPQEEHEARIITPFSLKGGSGVTTLAVNLGVSLAQMWTCKVAVVDMGLHNAQVPLFLDLMPRYTLTELTREQPAHIDSELLLNDYLIHHESQIHVLAGPKTPGEAVEIPPEMVDAFLPVLKKNFDYVIVDTSHDFSPPMVTALEYSDLVIVMLAPDLACTKAASDALNVLEEIGYPENQTVLILNRLYGQKGLALEDIQEAVGKRVVARFPFDDRHAIKALNRGKPLVIDAPNAPLTEAIEDFAYKLSRRSMEPQREGKPSSLLAKIKKRL
jgi:pilus assembly protein CpaE